MIPKTLHYIWLSHGTQSDLIKRCIESWQRVLPDYKIICWDENTFDITSAPQFVQDAYQAKRWAFASDYIRLWVLNTYGGIYLDTDTELYKPFDKFLNNSFFCGTQYYPIYTSKHCKKYITHLDSTVIGSEKQHPFVQDCLKKYSNLSFYNRDGSQNLCIINYLMTEVMLSYGYRNMDLQQNMKDGITVYPSSVFNGRASEIELENCFAYHWGEMSWLDNEKRGFLYKLCWNLDMMRLYKLIERFFKLFK